MLGCLGRPAGHGMLSLHAVPGDLATALALGFRVRLGRQGSVRTVNAKLQNPGLIASYVGQSRLFVWIRWRSGHISAWKGWLCGAALL